jgi:hypothetical protein
LFTHHYDAGQSLIAPWAADEDLLGHSSLVKRTLARQLALGHLRSLISSGRRYVGALQKFLHRQGYV